MSSFDFFEDISTEFKDPVGKKLLILLDCETKFVKNEQELN